MHMFIEAYRKVVVCTCAATRFAVGDYNGDFPATLYIRTHAHEDFSFYFLLEKFFRTLPKK